MTVARQPAGIPIGGEFAPTAKSASGVALGADPADAPPGSHEVHAREVQYVGGGSDKFYRVYVDGTAVSAQYGRNGTEGTFTPPKEYADEAAAMKAADKIVAGKMAKGYELTHEGVMAFDGPPGESDLDRGVRTLPDAGEQDLPQVREQSGVVLSVNAVEDIDETAMPRVSAALEAAGMRRGAVGSHGPTRPMLARTVPPQELGGLLRDDDWVVQPKLDGDRVCITVDNGVVSVLNRQGQPKVRNVSEDMIAPFRGLTEGRWVMDGEVVGRTMHLFDMPAAGGFHDESAPFEQRAKALGTVLSTLSIDPAVVRPVATAAGEGAKRQMLSDAKTGFREGIILRHKGAGYENGRRADTLLKHKLAREVDAYIVATGVGGKENAVLAVRRADGTEQIVGQVSTIGKGDLKVGDVVEARFLNVADPSNPTLFQPRIMRKRTDKSAAECSIDQLAYAAMDKTYD